MIRKAFLTFAVAALFLGGIAVAAQSPAPATPAEPSAPAQATSPAQAPSSAQSQAPARQQSQSATGKITAVSGDTFSIEVGQGDTKQTLQFMTDPSTAKSGDLKVGSNAKVEYRTGADGKHTATKVDVES